MVKKEKEKEKEEIMDLLFGYPICSGCGKGVTPQTAIPITLEGEGLLFHRAKRGVTSCLTRFVRHAARDVQRRFESDRGHPVVQHELQE